MEISVATGQLERGQKVLWITSTTCCTVENGKDLGNLLTRGKISGGPWDMLPYGDTGSI